MTVRNNKVMTMSNRVSSTFAISASRFAIPALAVSMDAISSTAYADQRMLTSVSITSLWYKPRLPSLRCA